MEAPLPLPRGLLLMRCHPVYSKENPQLTLYWTPLRLGWWCTAIGLSGKGCAREQSSLSTTAS